MLRVHTAGVAMMRAGRRGRSALVHSLSSARRRPPCPAGPVIQSRAATSSVALANTHARARAAHSRGMSTQSSTTSTVQIGDLSAEVEVAATPSLVPRGFYGDFAGSRVAHGYVGGMMKKWGRRDEEGTRVERKGARNRPASCCPAYAVCVGSVCVCVAWCVWCLSRLDRSPTYTLHPRSPPSRPPRPYPAPVPRVQSPPHAQTRWQTASIC